MAQQIDDRTSVVRGAPTVEPSNSFFWFNRPQWILILIHLTLFQYEVGFKSCFHESLYILLPRILLRVALQFVCRYITFPLYALVTQMGSHMKKAIFEEQTAKALKKWQKAARDRKKLRKNEGGTSDNSVSGLTSGENTPSRGSSPIYWDRFRIDEIWREKHILRCSNSSWWLHGYHCLLGTIYS